MRKLTIILVFLVSLTCIQFSAAVSNETNQRKGKVDKSNIASALVKKLTSIDLDWKERFQAEETLKKMDSEQVLLALIPEAIKGMPGGGIANGIGSAKDNRILPPKWQVFYAVHRLWSYHYMKSLRENEVPLPSVGKRLIEYLSIAPSKTWVLHQLGDSGSSENYWLDEAEEPIVTLFRDPKTDAYLRIAAMRCLLRNTGKKYYSEIKAVLIAYPDDTVQQLYLKANGLRDLIYEHLRKRNKYAEQINVDNELLKSTFALLPRFEKLREGGGYFLSLALGSYVGHEFKADQNDPKYKGKHGLTPAFFADTTHNALIWWEKNRNKYKT